MKDEQTRLAIEALKAAGCGVLAIHVESRIAELEQDNQEQCRLNAMGAEREARLMARVKELEKDCCQLIDDRDERDEVIDELMAQVLGSDCKEWSSAYGFNDAVVDVEYRMKEIENESSSLKHDAARYLKLVESGNFVPATLSPSCIWGLRTSGSKSTKQELDAAVDAIDTAMKKD